jgi:hypothetical protein
MGRRADIDFLFCLPAFPALFVLHNAISAFKYYIEGFEHAAWVGYKYARLPPTHPSNPKRPQTHGKNMARTVERALKETHI